MQEKELADYNYDESEQRKQGLYLELDLCNRENLELEAERKKVERQFESRKAKIEARKAKAVGALDVIPTETKILTQKKLDAADRTVATEERYKNLKGWVDGL